MSREPMWRRYLRFWGPAPGSDVADELDFHIQTAIQALIASGMDPREARAEALRRFGPMGPVRKECTMISRREVARRLHAEYLEGWWRDLVYVIRILYKSKLSTAAAFLILAVGIGASTAVFTLLDRLLYRPLPVENASELVRLSESFTTVDGSREVQGMTFSYPGYVHLRDRSRSFSGLIAEASFNGQWSLTGETPVTVNEQAVTGNYFNVLGIPVHRGRVFGMADETGDTHVAVLGYAFWTRAYGQSPEAVGQTMYLRGTPYSIVGVLGPEFRGTWKGREPDVYVPLAPVSERLGPFALESVGTHMFSVLGRRRSDVSLRMAQAELDVLWPQFIESSPFASMSDNFRPDPATARVRAAHGAAGYEALQGERRTSMLLLGAVVGTIFLIGCVNVTCFLLARAASRRAEIDVHLTLGAGVTRILRQSLMESGLLAGLGTVAGMVLAVWIQRLILAGLQWGDRPIDLALDGRVVAFGGGLAIATGLACGLAPAFQLLRGARMRIRSTGAGWTFTSLATGKAFVAVEVALCLVLVASATMFLRGFQNLRSVPLGFDASDVAVVRITTSEAVDLPLLERIDFLMEEGLRLTETLDSAEAWPRVAVADSMPFDTAAVGYGLTRSSDAAAQPEAPVQSMILRVDEDYFDVLNIAVRHGRPFTARDDGGSPAVGIVGETVARNLFGEANPIGQQVRIEDQAEVEIVGVVADVKHRDIRQAAPAIFYMPVRQPRPGGAVQSSLKIQVRSPMTAEEVAAIVGGHIESGGFQLRVQSQSALEDDIGASYSNDRIRMQATAIFGILALLLIGAGVYGLMAYVVGLRSREIGIRMAVGSTGFGIVRLVFKDSITIVGIGLLVGTPAALAALRLLSGFAYDLSPADPASLIVAILILTGTALVASAGPAIRGARIDPAITLRAD